MGVLVVEPSVEVVLAEAGGQTLLEDLLDIVFYLVLVGVTVGATSLAKSRTARHAGGRDGDCADERLPRGASPLAQPGTDSFPESDGRLPLRHITPAT